ncbi:hypothetical protein GOARA_029_00060 [Gordonia araii NBRC 100433]|uniref:Ribonuclease VapC n=1 Tax=Gordonia araii NBRC 100433 TaxID=1073574 RepID=G7GZW7_9ACTN|nr:type II toxin-antitoxin system VapC family toxin [Gordonia araii]NNG99183.1 type II toxin-antitoxin system VapC family toxin [Gordonia araii NBRC 100433]GAB09142.1 hypothetical protein GOARA_029_00060 [Gordonia araii NBRC 100433]
MRLVLDASVLTEVLIASPIGTRLQPDLYSYEGALHLPHLADVETMSVLSRLARRQVLTEDRARQATQELRVFPARRWPADALMLRIWDLRKNLTPYDANYVALAEVLDAEFWTRDARLYRAISEHSRCRGRLIG